MKKDKVVIIGAGYVGACCAFTMMLGGTAGEIVLIDIDRERLEGEVLDLSHGLPFVQPVKIKAGDYPDCRDAELIIITAGAAQRPGESRLNLIQRNVDIFKNIIPQIIEYNRECILLVVTNPVDVITYAAQKLSGFPANRVIGSGTVLDSARFRYLLGEHCHVAPASVHGYVIGEHGDSEVCAFSATHIAGMSMDEICQDCKHGHKDECKAEMTHAVRTAAYQIIEGKGATYYAVALAVRRIADAILRNEGTVLSVSALLDGEYGFSDVYVSLPCVLDAGGVSKILTPTLSREEMDGLTHSVHVLKDAIASVKW
jgi:L-lactate dehydrogenase